MQEPEPLNKIRLGFVLGAMVVAMGTVGKWCQSVGNKDKGREK